VLGERAIERGLPTIGTTGSRFHVGEGLKSATAELKKIRRLDELNGLADELGAAGRADDVREDDADRLADVPRRRSRAREGSRAVGAELRSLRVLLATVRAPHAQQCTGRLPDQRASGLLAWGLTTSLLHYSTY